MISEKLDKLATREKVGLAAASFFIFALVVEKLVVQSIVDQSRRLDVDIKAMTVSVAINQDALQSRDRVARDYERVSDVLAKVVSKDEAIADMKGEIDDLARRTKISLQSMEHREPVPAEMGYGEEYSVVIGNFEADIQDLLTFLYELQKSPGLLRVGKLSVSPGKSKGQVKGALAITKVMTPAGG